MTDASRPGRPPVVVLLGGPSAEHDVSIVSGPRSPTPSAAPASPSARSLIDLDGALVVAAGGSRPRRIARPRAYDDPAALGAEGPLERRRGARPARRRATRPRSSSSRSMARSARTARSRPCSRRPGWPTPAPGSSASAIGMDKALQKRLWRGLGLPVVDWREVSRRRLAREPDAVLARARRVRRGDRRAASDDQAGAPRHRRSGMTLAHAPDERAAALELAFRYDTLALVERYLAAARDLEVSIIGTEPPLGRLRPGRDRRRPRVLRLRREVHARPVRDLDARRARRSSASRSGSSPATPTGPSAPRASPASTSCSSGDESTCRRSTRSRALRRSASSRRLPAEAGLDFSAVCRRVIDLALERHAARAAAG